MVIIGLCGLQGSGKDSAADHLVSAHGFVRLSFAKCLKEVVAIMFGWSTELLEGRTAESRQFRDQVDEWWSAKLGIVGFTPRMALQMIGTDVFREHFHTQIWVSVLERTLDLAVSAGSDVVITDCRFRNEVDAVLVRGGRIFHLERFEPLNPEVVSHISETALHEYLENGNMIKIKNSGTMEDLGRAIDAVL